VQAALARAYADFLVSAQGQALIASFKIDNEQLFVPDASAK
jgi:ABC-type tungstate transport system permease subunit